MKIMKFNWKIAASSVIIVALFIAVANFNTRTNAKDNSNVEARAENNCLQLIDKIRHSEPSNGTDNANNTTESFTKKQMIKDNSFKQDRISMENDSVIVESDTYALPITYINKAKVTSEQLSKKIISSKYDQQQLKDIAEEAISGISENQLVFLSSKKLDNGYIEYRWKRTYGGYEFNFDFMLVVMDPQDGTIVTISKRFVSENPSINIVKTKEESINIAKQLLANNQNIHLDSVLSVNKGIVNPNKYWLTPNNGEFNLQTRLAYIITFSKGKATDETATVWIDCENGNILGGNETL